VDAAAKGFTIADDSTKTEAPSPKPYGVMLERVDSIHKIDDVTIELLRKAHLHHGEDEGWETSVEKD
jgi:hypothetical protein